MPLMRQIGFDAATRPGSGRILPAGGGRISAVIRPACALSGLQMAQRGRLLRIYGISAVSNLPLSIAERQKRQALLRLQQINWLGTPDIRIKIQEMASPVKGTFILLVVEFEVGRACYCALGEPGKPAERVADEAMDGLMQFLESGAAVDPYLADQLLLPLSLASSKSHLYTARISQHLLTNAEIIRLFLPVQIEIEGDFGQPGLVTIHPGK